MPKGERQGLVYQAEQQILKISGNAFGGTNGGKVNGILSLSSPEKKSLQEKLLKEIDYLGTNGKKFRATPDAIHNAKVILNLLFSSPAYHLGTKELQEKSGMTERSVKDALILISENDGIGIVKRAYGFVGINPEITAYLERTIQ